jgi:hypothetical protein
MTLCISLYTNYQDLNELEKALGFPHPAMLEAAACRMQEVEERCDREG